MRQQQLWFPNVVLAYGCGCLITLLVFYKYIMTKPYITYVANDFVLQSSLKTLITNDLPTEGIEWQRSYGRPSKTVYIETQLVPLSDDHIRQYNQQAEKKEHLLRLPLLHTFWIELGENDSYKNTSREEVMSWISKFRDYGINEWLIVLIETNDSRKTTKTKLLSRTSALDKIKADMPPNLKNPAEHCIMIPDVTYNSGKPTEGYTSFLTRLRQLLLVSYSRQLTAYEDFIRTKREKRNAKGWNFFEFFFLQEELAFAFETLGLYDEALVQYDELDALFSQFVINSYVGEIPDWLKKLSDQCDVWHGLCLAPLHSKQLREKLKGDKRSLLDLRSYLFARQCELLLLHNRPWELASRSLPFLQNCVNELKMLDIVLPEGAVACWVFLSALEILQKCERYSDSSQMETYSRHTVELWAYLRNKLEVLGTLCGLMPDQEHTSGCLHRVVSLIGGIGDDFYPDREPPSPQSKLKEALSKPAAFLKNYLEMSELTMGTYKHICRMRSARLIGLELASLYMKMNEPQKALPFLIDLEKAYLMEHWSTLLSDVRKLLFECYDILDDTRKRIQYCCSLVASNCLPVDERRHFFNICKDLVARLPPDQDVISKLNEIFPVLSVDFPDKELIVTNSPVRLELTVVNNFPETVECNRLSVSLKVEQAIKSTPRAKIVRQQSVDHCPHGPQRVLTRLETFHPPKPVEPILRAYRSAAGVGLKCPNISRCLKRSDSHGAFFTDKEPVIDTSEARFTAESVTLEPGLNKVTLTFEPKLPVTHTLHQISLAWSSNVTFVSTHLPSHVCFGVMAAEPSLKVLGPPTMDRVPFEILSGIPQNIVLELNSGTSRIEQGTRLKIRVSRDLVMKLQADLDGEAKSEIELALTVPLKPFDSFPIALLIKGKLANQRDTSVSEYTLTLSYETRGEVNVTKSTSTSIQLIAPLVSSLRLHTAHTRKFAEIILNGGSHQGFRITNPRMFRNDVNDELQIVGEAKQLVVTKEQSVHLVWEVDDSKIASRLILRLNYSLIDERNTLPGQSLPETYECEFRLKSYSTMFTVRAAIEPQKGFEFCRVGTLCSLKVTIDRICPADEACAIMYEVIGDSSTWNCTGRSAGVIDATIADLVNSSLTFDILPLASGYLPLPTVRLSKYVPSTMDTVAKAADTSRRSSLSNNSATSDQQASVGHSEARLVAFEVGQVYNASRALQVHVLPSSGLIHVDV